MTNVLKIKRRVTGSAGAPATLKGGELAYNEIGDVLYYGKGDNGSGDATSVVAVAGSGNGGVTITGAQTISGDKTFSGLVDLTGTFKIDGVEVTASSAELNQLAGVTAGTASASKALIVDANKDLNLSGGDLTVQDMVVSGNLTVSGTTTTIDTANLAVKDKNIEVAVVASPTNTTADGAGITVKGATDKTFQWANATGAFTSSEHLDVASGKVLKIAGTEVLSASALGSGVTGSSLTSVGTISSGTWQGTAVALAYGGTGSTTASDARTALGLAIGSDVQAYDSELAAIAGLTSAANKGVYFTGSGAAATYDLSSFGRTVAGLADAAALISELSLVVGTNVQAYDAELAAIAGLTSAADKGIMFSGAGTAATFDLSSFGRSLVDDVDASAARTTLGLGSIATQASSNVSITGGSIDGITLDGGSF
jgi:hypothetical protein